jgi:dihydrofolate reductase
MMSIRAARVRSGNDDEDEGGSMGTLTVITNTTLDGVMQAPGRPDEDTRGGFRHGGWATPYSSDAMGRLLAGGPGRGGAAMLLGRRTYDDFAGFWPNQPDNPYTEALTKTRKYVVSDQLAEPLRWQNSTVLRPGAVAALKDRHDLIVLGSGVLIRSLLLPQGLIDELKLLLHPLTLGTGQRLFGNGQATFALSGAEPTTTGVVIAAYRPAGS